MRCVLSIGFLAVACGNTAGTEQKGTNSAGAGGTALGGAPSSGGSSGTGSGAMAGTGGAAGRAGSGDFIDDLMDASGALCREVRRCYPELQDDPTQCTAPADNGNTVVWLDPTSQLTAAQIDAWKACLRASEDQAGLRAWAECLIADQEEAIACIAECPTSAQACAEAGNAGPDGCDALEPSDVDALNMCVAAILQ